MNSFPEFPEESEVWIYAADRFLNSEEVTFVQERLNAFVGNWKTHGQSLCADAKVIDDVFVVFVTDVRAGTASGCSIDTSVRFMKELGQLISVDFFNRLKVVVRKDDQLDHASFHDLPSLSGYNYADVSIKTLGHFRASFFTSI